jgi:hypothetical protein
MLRRGDANFAVDLWLDVLVRDDGVTHGVYDQEEFDDAVRRGWLSERDAGGARAGLGELTELIERGRLVEFLADAHPFARVKAPEAPAMQPVRLREVPLLQPSVRPSW